MNSPQEHHARSQALRRAGDLDGALLAARKIVELAPNIAAAWATLGVAAMELGQLAEADACFRRALALEPNNPAIQFNLAETLLLKGDFAGAWPYFEAGRLVGNAGAPQQWPKPQWDGSPLDGRTILLHADAGFGDSIQFVRYASALRDTGAKVLLLCQPELRSLLAAAPGISQILSLDVPFPPFDLHAPLMSLPRLMNTTLQNVPANVPYLSADPSRVELWRNRLQPATGLRIGVAWAGRPTHVNDFQRSLQPDQLQPLFEIANTTFYSLQNGRPPASANAKLVDWTSELIDFADTAALVVNLDLVVTVDTSVAHLAGAMGKPVWVLLPFAPDWRWMLKREDSPWYPTMRLFRQTRPQRWEDVIQRIIAELGSMADS